MGSPRTEEKSLASEWTEHRVTITKPLYFGRYEVRQDAWFRLMGVATSWKTGDDLPVIGFRVVRTAP